MCLCECVDCGAGYCCRSGYRRRTLLPPFTHFNFCILVASHYIRWHMIRSSQSVERCEQRLPLPCCVVFPSRNIIKTLCCMRNYFDSTVCASSLEFCLLRASNDVQGVAYFVRHSVWIRRCGNRFVAISRRIFAHFSSNAFFGANFLFAFGNRRIFCFVSIANKIMGAIATQWWDVLDNDNKSFCMQHTRLAHTLYFADNVGILQFSQFFFSTPSGTFRCYRVESIGKQ